MPCDLPARPSGTSASRVTVVTDAAAATGLGHLVRSSALAGELVRAGAHVSLHLPPDSLPHAVDGVRAAGMDVRVQERTVGAVLAPSGSGGVVIVDSYRVDGSWLTQLHTGLARDGGTLAVVDDQADRDFPADLVLNQNVGADRRCYPRAGRILTGPRYALLRPEFPRHRGAALQALASLPERPQRVLVLFGGTDATGMAMTAARAARRAFPGAEVRAVVPGGAGTGRVEPGISVLGHVEGIHREMLGADLVLTAGGSTLWELCCLARPTAVVAVADNQQPTYDQLALRDAILPVARKPLHDVGALAERLRELTEPAGSLRRVAAKAAELTDGRGAERVAAALAELAFPAPGLPPERS